MLRILLVLIFGTVVAAKTHQGCPHDVTISHGQVSVLKGSLRFKCHAGYALRPKNRRSVKCVHLKVTTTLPRCVPTRPPNDDPGIADEDYEGYDEDKEYGDYYDYEYEDDYEDDYEEYNEDDYEGEYDEDEYDDDNNGKEKTDHDVNNEDSNQEDKNIDEETSQEDNNNVDKNDEDTNYEEYGDENYKEENYDTYTDYKTKAVIEDDEDYQTEYGSGDDGSGDEPQVDVKTTSTTTQSTTTTTTTTTTPPPTTTTTTCSQQCMRAQLAAE